MIVELIEAVLLVLGFLSVVGACIGIAVAFAEPTSPPADPYREGLEASARITAAAWEAERALFGAAREARSEK